jgi:hypothetical protein
VSDADRKFVWETLRTHQDHARAESALQALDRVFDGEDALQAALARAVEAADRGVNTRAVEIIRAALLAKAEASP